MATASQTIWQATREELITAALRKLTVLGEGESPTATQLSDGSTALNGLLATFQTFGLMLWKRTTLDIPMVSGQDTYTIGIGQTINQPFPLKVLQALLTVSGSSSQIDLTIEPQYNFNMLPINSDGTVVNINYTPKINYGELRVWPTPNTSGDTLSLIYQAPLGMFVSGTETLDLPQEWYNAIIYGLADLLSDEYGLPLEDRRQMERRADKYLSAAAAFGIEDGSITFFPTRNY